MRRMCDGSRNAAAPLVKPNAFILLRSMSDMRLKGGTFLRIRRPASISLHRW